MCCLGGKVGGPLPSQNPGVAKENSSEIGGSGRTSNFRGMLVTFLGNSSARQDQGARAENPTIRVDQAQPRKSEEC